MAAPDESRTTPAMKPVGAWAVATAITVKNRAERFAFSAPRTIAYDTSLGLSVLVVALDCRTLPHANRDFVARPASVGQPHTNGGPRAPMRRHRQHSRRRSKLCRQPAEWPQEPPR